MEFGAFLSLLLTCFIPFFCYYFVLPCLPACFLSIFHSAFPSSLACLHGYMPACMDTCLLACLPTCLLCLLSQALTPHPTNQLLESDDVLMA